MPTYKFRNTQTEEVFEEFMTISSREAYLKENPFLVQMPVSIDIVHETGTNLKVDDGFREVLGHIKNRYKVNKIKDY